METIGASDSHISLKFIYPTWSRMKGDFERADWFDW